MQNRAVRSKGKAERPSRTVLRCERQTGRVVKMRVLQLVVSGYSTKYVRSIVYAVAGRANELPTMESVAIQEACHAMAAGLWSG